MKVINSDVSVRLEAKSMFNYTNIFNDINCIHDNDVNNIAEWDLLNDTLFLSKYTKNNNNNYSRIIHRCMNTCRGRDEYK